MDQDAIDWPALTAARRARIRNPHDAPSAAVLEADAWFTANWSVIPGCIAALLVKDSAVEARKLVLAAVAWHADHRAAGGADQLNDLTSVTKRTAALALDPKDIERLEGALYRFDIEAARFVGTSAAARTVRAAAWRLCFGSEVYHALESQPVLRENHVLILGESGSGKELVAQMIIAGTLSNDREAAPARVLNSAAVPATLAGAELFGHARGAFTGADSSREGRIVEADGGTLFLDEIADLHADVQAMLLRTIESGVVQPIGTTKEVRVSVRFLSATQKPILDMVRSNAFRFDLYQRIARSTIVVPPLRERREDILPIARAFLDRKFPGPFRDRAQVLADLERAQRQGKSGIVTPREMAEGWLADAVSGRKWCGNVRELEAAIVRAAMGAPDSEDSGSRVDVPHAKPMVEGAAAARLPADELRTRVPVLFVTAGPSAGRLVRFPAMTVAKLGRLPDCDLALEDACVSGLHAGIVMTGKDFVIEDWRSTNGTFVNGEKVTTRMKLVEGDKIQLGSESVLRLWLADEKEVAAIQRLLHAVVADTQEPAGGVASGESAAASGDPKQATDPLPPVEILRAEAKENDVLRWYLELVLERVGYNLSHAEKVLGVDRGTIRRRMMALGLNKHPKQKQEK